MNRNPDFFPLVVNVYSGTSQADFLVLLLLCCGSQAVVRGMEGALAQAVAAWAEMGGVTQPSRSCGQARAHTPMGTGSAVLLPWCCCFTARMAFCTRQWWKQQLRVCLAASAPGKTHVAKLTERLGVPAARFEEESCSKLGKQSGHNKTPANSLWRKHPGKG